MTITSSSSLGFVSICVLAGTIWTVIGLLGIVRRRIWTTSLKGPANKSFLFGLGQHIAMSPDPAVVYEKWAQDYGSAYVVPAPLGSKRVVLCDPKAITHFYSRETFGYVHTPLSKISVENLFGRGLLWSEGESHKRQRKALSPAFTNSSIKHLVPVFLDCVYKVKVAWDTMLEASTNNEAVIDVQDWMNRVSLDSIGLAGFSYDFGALDGRPSVIASVFKELNTTKATKFDILQFVLAMGLPSLARLPSSRTKLVKRFRTSIADISVDLLARTRQEKEGTIGDRKSDKSVIGLLVNSENTYSDLYMSPEEIRAQMSVLVFAGYETTSISMTWALIELCKKPGLQTKLREEVSQYGRQDPTWEQVMNGMPFLDAVVQEVLRVHPPTLETTRMASEDDVVPLSVPVTTSSGKVVDRISIAKGTLVSVSISFSNRSETFWGPDAKEFIPERWLDNGPFDIRARDIQGYRHLLTFSDGPRMCIGKEFALAEFKNVLALLIRNYVFEFRDGPETKIGIHRGILQRPKIEGEMGSSMPLLIRRFE